MTYRQLSAHDDLDQPYARVRDTVLANPSYVFRRATSAAVVQSAALRVGLGAIDVGVEVELKVLRVTRDADKARLRTELQLAWSAAHVPKLFPVMEATLAIFPLGPRETRLQLAGTYRPPLGKAGEVVDAVVGKHVAQAVVQRFIDEVAAWLREELQLPMAAAPPAPEETPEPASEVEC